MKTIITSIKFTLFIGVFLFVSYVLVLWGFAALVKHNHGESEVILLNNKVVGAANVGQLFTRAEYFWGRPSAVNYDGSASGASNKAASNPIYLQEVEKRTELFLIAHPYLEKSDIPSELVTASASGLDPHISPKAAEIQIRRVAEARGVSEEAIKKIVENQTHQPFMGRPYINVLALNVALGNAANN